jgi:hypothetical protein
VGAVLLCPERVAPRGIVLPVTGMIGVVTIHSDHPFMPPESDRSPIRRLRGRLTAGPG